MSDMGGLSGVRILVTGATSGLGAAMATALAEAGARVMVTGREQGRAEAIATKLGQSPVHVGAAAVLGGRAGRVRDVVETKLVGCHRMARAVVPMMLRDGGGRVVNISMNEQTMVRRGFAPYGPAGAGVEALSRVMAADLAGSSVTVNILLPGGSGTRTGMIPDQVPAEVRARLQDPAVIGPPIAWLASDRAAGVHDRRIVATEFDTAATAP